MKTKEFCQNHSVTEARVKKILGDLPEELSESQQKEVLDSLSNPITKVLTPAKQVPDITHLRSNPLQLFRGVISGLSSEMIAIAEEELLKVNHAVTKKLYDTTINTASLKKEFLCPETSDTDSELLELEIRMLLDA